MEVLVYNFFSPLKGLFIFTRLLRPRFASSSSASRGG